MSIGLATDGYFGGVGGGAGGGPHVSSATPVVGSTIDAGDEVVITVESVDDAEIDTIDSIGLRYIGSLSPSTIYNGSVFTAAFSDSTIDIDDGIATITLRALGGFKIGVAEVIIAATDEDASEGTDEVGSWFLNPDSPQVTPDPIPASDDVWTAIETIDLIARAVDRLPEYLRP